MKFSLFIHIESVDSSNNYATLYEQFIHLCKMADDAGFEAIWVGEHHGMAFTVSPNPFLLLTDLAHHTQNVRLGTGTIIAPFWHPIKLAGEAAMCDQITKGRLDIGIARGAYRFEYERLTNDMDGWQAGQCLREMIPAIKNLWRGDYTHNGKYWRFPKTTTVPKPWQQPHPPIWVAARDPNSHEFAVEHGCHVQVTPLWQGDEEVELLIERFNTACEKNQRQPRPQIMLLQHTYVGGNDAEVAEAACALSRFYCYFATWFKNEREINQGMLQPLSELEIAAMEQYTPQKMRTQNVVGVADEVIARLRRYEQLGVDQYSFWIDNGMSFEKKRDSLQRFINQIMPAFALPGE